MSNAVSKLCPICHAGLSRVQPGDGTIRYDCGSFFRPGLGFWIPSDVSMRCTVESERLLKESLESAKDAIMRYTMAFDAPLEPCTSCNAVGWHAPKKDDEPAKEE